MKQDQRYDFAVAAAVVVLEQIDTRPDMPRHERLAMATFSIMHAIERYDAEKGARPVEFSNN